MGLKINYAKTKLEKNQYYPTVYPKDAIFLHHTAGGGVEEAIDWWNQTPDRVGTALFVARDGAALQCFEINNGAYHLGIKGIKNNRDLHSVGIEIVSRGWLLQDEANGKFYAYPLYPLMKSRVLIPDDQVIKLDKPWRGYQFWHKYTDEQVATVIALCRYLVNRFEIPVQKDLSKFYEYDISVAKENKKGIYAHTTVRTDKWDIFPQPNLIEGIRKEFETKK